MNVVTATIISDGEEMDPSFELLSLDISREINRVPHAEIVLIDGEPSTQEFVVSNAEFFQPGKEIEIKLRYEGDSDETVFKGIVICHGIEAYRNGVQLVIRLKDKAVKLTQKRKSKVHRDASDNDAITAILNEAQLDVGDIAATDPVHPELVQYYCTDWDFLVARADNLGLMVVASDGTIDVKEIDLTGDATHHFEYGIDEIYNFEMRLDASHQFDSIESQAWNIEDQSVTDATTASAFTLSQGNANVSDMAQSIGFDTYQLKHPTPLANEELMAWANARMTRHRMAMLRGRLSVPGSAALKPMDLVELDGVGDRFTGKTMITGVRHRITDSGWYTDLQFGLSPDSYARTPQIADSAASGLLPPIQGLHVGIVANYEEDPDGNLRVKVNLPFIDTSDGTVWARLASPDAGDERGIFFCPEKDDEVVVGFFNNDPRQAVILGSLYSGSKHMVPPLFADMSEDNIYKGIVTKKGTKLGFIDNDKAQVFIETAAENKLLLDDDGESIALTDQHGNSVTLSADGVAIVSIKDISLEADGDIQITGSNISIEGDAVDIQ